MKIGMATRERTDEMTNPSPRLNSSLHVAQTYISLNKKPTSCHVPSLLPMIPVFSNGRWGWQLIVAIVYADVRRGGGCKVRWAEMGIGQSKA